MIENVTEYNNLLLLLDLISRDQLYFSTFSSRDIYVLLITYGSYPLRLSTYIIYGCSNAEL